MFVNQLLKSRYGSFNCNQSNSKHITFDFFNNNKNYPRLIDIDSGKMRLNYSLGSISCKNFSDLEDLTFQDDLIYSLYELKNLEYKPFIIPKSNNLKKNYFLEKNLSIDDHIITIDATKDVLINLPSKSFQDKEYIIKRVYGSKNITINSEIKNISPLNTVDLTNTINLGTKPNTTILIYNELNGGIWLQIQ